MRTVLVSASERIIREDFSDKIVFQLDLTASGARNSINGDVGVINSGISLSTDWVAAKQERSLKFLAASSAGVSFPHRAEYAPGLKNFTVEALFKLDNAHSLFDTYGSAYTAYREKYTPIFSWDEWGAPGKNGNMAFGSNHTNKTIILERLRNGAGGVVSNVMDTTTPLGQVVHMAAERYDGNVYLYRNGIVVDVTPDTLDWAAVVNQPLRIGSRRGGGDGSLYWKLIGHVQGLRITHHPIYKGRKFTPPTTLKL